MTLHEYKDLEQGSEQWLEARRGIVTASVVGQLITTKPPSALDYDCPQCDAGAGDQCISLAKKTPTPVKVPHSPRTTKATENPDDLPMRIEVADNDTSRGLTALLVAERITGHTEPTYMNDDMLRGAMDEPRARDLYSEHYAPATQTGFMVRDDWGFSIGYSPDGLVGDEGLVAGDGLLEVKSRRQKKHLLTILADEVPTENMAQLECGLLVSGRSWIDYISYSGGMPMWKKRVTPDPRWFAAIIAAVEQFEKNAAEMVATYEERVAGLPTTERIEIDRDLGLVF